MKANEEQRQREEADRLLAEREARQQEEERQRLADLSVSLITCTQ